MLDNELLLGLLMEGDVDWEGTVERIMRGGGGLEREVGPEAMMITSSEDEPVQSGVDYE